MSCKIVKPGMNRLSTRGETSDSGRIPTGALRLVAPFLLMIVLVACAQKAPAASPPVSTSSFVPPEAVPPVAGASTTAATPVPAGPTGGSAPSTTNKPALSVDATLARSCGAATHTQCLTEARAAVKNDAILVAQKCAPGAPEICHRQFGDPLVQACYPAGEIPAWGPDGWCSVIDGVLADGANGMSAAEAYAQAQAPAGFPFSFISPEVTWGNSTTLHVLHATPQGTGSYGGDYYFFFADGTHVGMQLFTGAVSSGAVDNVTYAVTYKVYVPGDAHCCPSGGQSRVRFHWDGTKLAPLDPTTGATQK